MDAAAQGHAHATRTYYDAFSHRYEAERAPNRPDGYHALVDDLEVGLVERYGAGRDVLECGAGTGLLLERFARFARSAKGIDLSPGMIAKAHARGLDVREASVTDIPFGDARFDVTCAFKVLPHVPDVGKALAEMARVTRPGGVVIAEFYNPLSLRAIAKRLAARSALAARAGRVSRNLHESDVYTRLDAPWIVPRILPPSLTQLAVRGVRIVTPAAVAMRVPLVGKALRTLEHRLADGPAAFFAGFYVTVLKKREGSE